MEVQINTISDLFIFNNSIKKHTGNNPVTHFCHKLSLPQGHIAVRRIMSMKNPTTLK
jgi:hypothetical protein